MIPTIQYDFGQTLSLAPLLPPPSALISKVLVFG
jgi:hypothetical protein